MLTFAIGVKVTFTASRSAWGPKSQLDFEVHATEGLVSHNQERMNELQLYQNHGYRSKAGFVTILTSPEHELYCAFCPAPTLLPAICDGMRASLDFAASPEIEIAVHAKGDLPARGRRAFFFEM